MAAESAGTDGRDRGAASVIRHAFVAGGTAGLTTVPTTDGNAWSFFNTQENGFQFGVNVDTVTRPFVVYTRIEAPFADITPAGYQSMGIFLGTGDQDNYFKLIFSLGEF